MGEENIHQRILKLKDVALGEKKAVPVSSHLAPASYDSAVDSLLALYKECKSASALSKDKHVIKFMTKYEQTVAEIESLRVSVKDFEMKSTIGRGHFGEVLLSKERSTGEVFAMKIMKKAHILQQPDAAFYSAERDIMAFSQSPWLTCLHYAFQDSSSLYLVMDYHPGGDLLTIMERREGSMQEEEARFYLVEIAAGLHDLHGLGFVHRDVKPENVLIARSGHIKLVDFGSAARLDKHGRVIESNLPVGTPEYISPEVLTSLDKSADYGVCCDWWSLGIIAYELLYETTPFEGESTSKTYSNIMNYKKGLSFPQDAEEERSKEFRELIKNLLTDMKTRLTYPDIQAHPFFSGVDWDHLLNTTPPHIPTVSGPDDVSNFDVFEPRNDNDLRHPDLPTKCTGFSGRSLPFIGFTYTSMVVPKDFTDSSVPGVVGGGNNSEGTLSGELRKAHQLTKKELEGEKRRRISFQRECAVYQSQLEEFQRKLEVEKSDRRVSESRALQLLQEVKEMGKLAQQLREEQAKTTEVEYGVVVEQLEQERQEASRRSQRLQEKLKEVQRERDLALKKGSELKTRLSDVKEGCRKEVAALQSRLAKVTKESASRVEDLQERCAGALKKKDQAETAKKKAEMDTRKLKANVETSNVASNDLTKQLKEARLSYADLQDQFASQTRNNECLEQKSVSLTQQLQGMVEETEEANLRAAQMESVKLELEHSLSNFREHLKKVVREKESLVAEVGRVSKEMKAKSTELGKAKEENSKLTMSLAETKTLREISHKTNTDEKLKRKIETLEKENRELKAELSLTSGKLKDQNKRNRSLVDKMGEDEKKSKEAVGGYQARVEALQDELREKTTMAIQENEKLREMKKVQRDLRRKNSELTSKLSMAQSKSKEVEEQLKACRIKVENLTAERDKLKLEQGKENQLQNDNELMRKELAAAQDEIRCLKISRDQVKEGLSNVHKQLEARELNAALLQRNVKSLQDELQESKAMALEAQKQQARLKSLKDIVESDLETAEAKLEEAHAVIEQEKKTRLAAEEQAGRVAEDMGRQLSSHAEELQGVSKQLQVQKELAMKYSSCIMELEKEARLKGLALKETQKELNTEKAVSSKFYDEVQLKSRELNKLKAAHMKLLRESQQLNGELAEQKQVLSQQRMLSADHQLQETRLQATIAQQGKLIDYLQGMGRSPDSKRAGRGVRGFKLGRKGRDPAKEIAEWNKLKGIVGKGSSSGVVPSTSSQSVSDQQTETSSEDLTSPPRHLSPHTTFPDPQPPAQEESPMEASTSNNTEQSPSNTAATAATAAAATAVAAAAAAHGTKRKSSEVASSTSKQTAQHNIPHVFRGISKSGLRSNYTCAACKGPIKALQKLIKCTYCHIPCHAQCIDTIPNNCGLSEELSAYISEAKEPAAKRKKRNLPSQADVVAPTVDPEAPGKEKGASSKRTKKITGSSDSSGKGGLGKLRGKKARNKVVQMTRVSNGDGAEMTEGVSDDVGAAKSLLQVSKVTSSSAAEERTAVAAVDENVAGRGAAAGKLDKNAGEDSVDAAKTSKPLYTGFELSKVIRMEKTMQPRGGMMAEGWLVLTMDTLCLYDRDPRGVTRKPIHRFVLAEPDVAYIVEPSIPKHLLPHTLPSNLVKAFGLHIFSSSYSKELCFMASSLQSKIEWVEAIQKVLSRHTTTAATEPPHQQLAKQEPPLSWESKSGGRELKAVSIVPLPTKQGTPIGAKQAGMTTSDASNLDLSIRSSMLDTSSDSDSSFI